MSYLFISWMYDSFHLEGLTLIMFITSLNLLSHQRFQENIGTMTWSVKDLQGSFRESTKSQISLTRFYIHRKLCKELTPWQYLEELSLKSAAGSPAFPFFFFADGQIKFRAHKERGGLLLSRNAIWQKIIAVASLQNSFNILDIQVRTYPSFR